MCGVDERMKSFVLNILSFRHQFMRRYPADSSMYRSVSQWKYHAQTCKFVSDLKSMRLEEITAHFVQVDSGIRIGLSTETPTLQY